MNQTNDNRWGIREILHIMPNKQKLEKPNTGRFMKYEYRKTEQAYQVTAYGKRQNNEERKGKSCDKLYTTSTFGWKH
jgi:hypothetical protein